MIGAAGSYMSARQANKPRNGYTNSTSTQNPYMADNLNPGLEDIINIQRGLVDRGAPQIDRNGNISYAALPYHENIGTPSPGPTGGGGTGGGHNRANAPALTPAQQRRRAARQNEAGGNTAAGGGSTSAPRPASAEDIFREAAQRGFDAGDTETQTQARNATANILGAAGGGGPETTGFEGYNPILDRLAGTLEGDVGDRRGRDLLLGFLNEDSRGGGSSGSGGDTNAPRVHPGTTGGLGTGSSAYYQNQQQQTTGNNANGVPDTMVPDSYFGQQTRAIMDEQANQQELEDTINLMNQDVERGMYRDLAQLDSAAQGSGRFGGSMFAGMSRDAREEALQEMAKNASQVRIGDREARRQARLAALGGVNTRDLGLLNANVQREAIAAGERSANASASAGAGAAADQIALQRRGQDLSALGALLDYEQGGVGQLSNIGSQLSSDRLNAMGMVPGLEGIGISGLNVALGGGQGLADIRANAANAANARAGINVQRAGQLQQLGMFNAGQSQGLVNDYLNSLRGIGSMGGVATTNGMNVQPGAGVSPSGAALSGALGGAAVGAGIYQQYRR